MSYACTVFASWGHRAATLDRLAGRHARRRSRDRRRIIDCVLETPIETRRRHSHTQGGLLLIASVGFGALAILGPKAAHAQNATWLLNPGSGAFNTATNWNPAVVPTNTAIFGASNTTSILFLPFTTTSIGTLQFNPGAPAYSFTTSEPLFTSISITGAGIVNDSSNAPTFIVGSQANLFFRNASTAGNATIITNAVSPDLPTAPPAGMHASSPTPEAHSTCPPCRLAG